MDEHLQRSDHEFKLSGIKPSTSGAVCFLDEMIVNQSTSVYNLTITYFTSLWIKGFAKKSLEKHFFLQFVLKKTCTCLPLHFTSSLGVFFLKSLLSCFFFFFTFALVRLISGHNTFIRVFVK